MHGMDAIASILPQIQSANGAGSASASASDPAEAGLFASLLSGQTGAVTPVPAIPSRPNGGNAFAAATNSETGPVLTALTQSPAAGGAPAGSATANGDPAAAASLPASTGAQASGQSANPAPATGAVPGNGTGAAPGNGNGSAGAASAPPSPAIDGNSTAAATAASKSGTDTAATGKVQASSPEGVTSPQPEGGEKSAVKTNVAIATNGAADSGPKAAETASVSPASDTARSSSATPAAPQATATQAAMVSSAAANTPAAAIAAASVPQTPVQAGVQARRQASGADKMPLVTGGSVAKSAGQAASGTASSATSTAVSSIKPDTAAPAPQPAQSQPPTPPTAELPAEAARLAMSDAARAAPPPVDVAQSDSEAEAERVDMSNLRAADASRTAERPGSAAGSARFTPAAAGTLAAQIAAKFQNGERRFEIRMDPPELGRIEVKLQVGNDNRVQAMLSAERPETLNDLRQYARELERALEEAGLELGHDGLSFELSQGEDDPDQTPSDANRFSVLEFTEDHSGPITAAAPPRELYGFQLSARSGVDIRL